MLDKLRESAAPTNPLYPGRPTAWVRQNISLIALNAKTSTDRLKETKYGNPLSLGSDMQNGKGVCALRFNGLRNKIISQLTLHSIRIRLLSLHGHFKPNHDQRSGRPARRLDRLYPEIDERGQAAILLHPRIDGAAIVAFRSAAVHTAQARTTEDIAGRINYFFVLLKIGLTKCSAYG